MKRWGWLFLTLTPLLLQGAPYQDSRDQLSAIRNDLRNLEVEFQQMKERLSNQDNTLETIQSDVKATAKNQTLEGKLDDLLNEVRTIKTHANKLADEIEINRKKSQELEANFATVQRAINSVMEALGIESSGKVYTVKPGDSLGGIAQKNRTTIHALKKLNRLKSDKIFAGQKLKLP